MDQHPTDIDFDTLLSGLLDQLDEADPAEAPELAARVADELQRRLRR